MQVSYIIMFLLYSRAVLVENIPEDISFLDNTTSHLPLSVGLYNLLDQAIRVVEIVSPLWVLNSSDYESSFQPAARQVKPEQANRDLSHQSVALIQMLCIYLFSVSTSVSFCLNWPLCLLYIIISGKKKKRNVSVFT